MKQIPERLSALHDVMKKNSIAAYIIPGTDPHASEYIADYWKEREWISGFTGSAGTVALTLTKAGLWTDSRYFLQGAEQLKGTGIELMKQGLPETLEIIPWLSVELKAGDKVGVNPQMFSANAYSSMKAELGMSGIELVSIDLIDMVWNGRPALPSNPFFVFDTKYNGKSAKEKLNTLRAELKKAHANVFVMSALDDIAWLFNIRGNDVSFNPVVIAYALVSDEKATLFIEPEKIPAEGKEYLKAQGVETASYLDIYEYINEIPSSKAVLIDGAKLNRSLFEAIPQGCVVRNTMSPVFKLKSIKNETEIKGVRNAMVKDGVALTRFFKWLEENVKKGELSEMSISNKLRDFRAEQELFVGESFDTIAGYAAHGAIVHYRATPESNFVIKEENLLLLDSGGQFFDGTTDITRTVAMGTPTIQQIIDFTLVLKGHINLATAIFPVGTRGSQLDILARKAMWDLGVNYGHGTGHGIGHFLNVHEGPQSIRMDENSTTLQLGMITSNEPGLYRANEYGIRIENLILVVPAEKTEFGQFLKFETLTLFPIDQQLIDIEMLGEKEIEWLNGYHSMVYDSLSPALSEEERDWLAKKCAPIKIG
ncbi:aminopeptidase P family protein [Paludibacter sp. 221]|nr:aminopeptidase P family protein [Paludibacter sp. 221]NDV47434.1 aminopeptidase P family protein [Paludibacter sp. 221]